MRRLKVSARTVARARLLFDMPNLPDDAVVTDAAFAEYEQFRRSGESDDELINRMLSFVAQRTDSPVHEI